MPISTDVPWRLRLGADPTLEEGVLFRVWAPHVRKVELLCGRRKLPLRRESGGYFSVHDLQARAGERYFYLLDGQKCRPDPASRSQPQGVHGPSEVIETGFPWTDSGWEGVELKDLVFYELHVGTFTPDGTFDALRRKLPYIKKLGVTCIEIMPVAQFPGRRNWGYDGVGLYAVQNSYGGPRALKRLIDACHRCGLAVCLDVVYNHLGPEGNYLRDLGPYFTSKYRTPWGEAVNYDDAGCEGVRRFVTDNACHWVSEYHVDALRLDAVHAIYDLGARHILQEIKEKVEAVARPLGRRVAVIAESDLNDPRVVRSPEKGGWGLDAQWSDDFHHAAHVALTGEKSGYYADFTGWKDVATAVERGFVYDGRFSEYRQRSHGAPADDIASERFVVCLQNHDQIGNRAMGDRQVAALSAQTQMAMAALLFFQPSLPLVFMGQEYGETAPFRYFIDHQDRRLVEAVRKGRRREFASFGWPTVPDPKSTRTFIASKLRWRCADSSAGSTLQKAHRRLIAMRKKYGWAGGGRPEAAYDADRGLLTLTRRLPSGVFVLRSSERPLPAVEGRLLFDAAKISAPISSLKSVRSCYNLDCRIHILSCPSR